MEKDYFLDRTIDVSRRDDIKIGDIAFICLKENQTTAKELKDLTIIKIEEIMTPIEFHPMGIKVKGKELDCFDPNFKDSMRTGRIVYMFNSPYSVSTSNGSKIVSRTNSGIELIDIEEIKNKKRPVIWFGVLDFTFAMLYDPFLYIDNSDSDDIDKLNNLNIKNATFSRGVVTFEINDQQTIKKEVFKTLKEKEPINTAKAFLEIRQKLSGINGIDGYSTSLPIKFIGFSLSDVNLKEIEES